MGTKVELTGKGQKPVQAVPQTPQPVMSKTGFKLVEAAQATDGNTSGGKVIKKDPNPAQPGAK